jgi:hypothetical protein
MTVWMHDSFPRYQARRRVRWGDVFIGLILGAGLATSLLLAIAVVLGAVWLVIRVLSEITRLVGGT